MRQPAAALRQLLAQPAMQVTPGCGDGMGARLIQEAGFKVGFASGSSISAMRLAMPDMDLLTFAEMRDAVEAIVTAAPEVLWLADGDTGYGNAISVQRTVRAYARAGAAAVLIEDKQWPRQLGNNGAKLVIKRDEARLRLRAAIETAREEGVLLLARTDACSSRGFGEALARLQDFVAEGADIFFLDSPGSEAEMRASVEASGGVGDLAGREALHARRCRADARGHQDGDLPAGDPGRHGARGPRRPGRAAGRPARADGDGAGAGRRHPVAGVSGA